MKIYQFTNELSTKAMSVYSNSNFTFVQSGEQFFTVYDGSPSINNFCGELLSIEEVNEFLESFEND